MRAPPTRTIERANNRSHKIRKRNVGKKKKGNYAGRQMTRPIADGWWRLQDKSSVNRFLIDSRVRRSWVLKRRLLRFTSLYPDWSPMRTVTYFYLLVPGLDEFISNLMCVCVCVCVCVRICDSWPKLLAALSLSERNLPIGWRVADTMLRYDRWRFIARIVRILHGWRSFRWTQRLANTQFRSSTPCAPPNLQPVGS